MKNSMFLCTTAMVFVVAATVPAAAQTVPPAAPSATVDPASSEAQAEDTDIIVTGVRASLASAQNIKRNADSIVDSIVAEDIGKLPDNNATEALQRVTGVQVSRDVGEGGNIAIRGLPQVQTNINGRQTFTAGAGRSFNLQDLPAELIARIDVFKSPTADLIEGGLGGSVDIRTRRPMDFAGFTASATLRNNYADSVKKSAPSASLLLSNRWETGIGEIGLLGAVSYQERKYRQDLNSTGAPLPRNDAIAGQSVFAPNGANQVLVVGKRERIGGNVALQWRPTPELEMLLEGQYQRFKTTQDQFNANVTTAGTTVIGGSAALFSGTNNAQQISYANVPIVVGGTARDFKDENKSIALNTRWSRGAFTLVSDAIYTESTNDLFYTELDLTTRLPVFSQNLGSNPPSTTAPGFDLANLAGYTVAGLTRNENHFIGNEKAFRVDGTYDVGSFIKSIQTGFRYSQREIEQRDPLRYVGRTTRTNPALYPGLFQANGFNDFYAIEAPSGNFLRNYPYAATGPLRNQFADVLSQLGLTGALAPTPTAINARLAAFSADEENYAAYALARFDVDVGIPIDGNVGVRWVKTVLSISGNQLQTTRNAQGVLTPVVPNIVEPVTVDSSYDNWLPSGNIRARLTDKLQFRLAGSRTLTRPDFNQLSPALTVVPGQLAASQGNPQLSPILSTNADASLEWYFGRSSSIYAAGFYKRVKGFIFTRSTPNVTIGGLPGYTLSQPENAGTGTVKGAEIGYQQFFDFLPGALSGLGVQANYTYADSSAPTSLVGFTASLPQLSKHSYNLTGIYEKSGISARVAYNYRSDFLSSILAGAFTPPGGSTVSYVFPVKTAGYGWLDASLNYDVNERLTLSVDAQNLLRTQIRQFYETPTRPGQYTVDDTQYMVGVRIKL
ncbi:TonB-dependent receptor [Sphingomonas mollis]|uniref:TonB-dependent receptor n=1 Tax=Sphingomonas mollis TaxID=2795726 RepID=A0ABS0XTQ6_9SPHN|nr:TonB-dependent receptor [Sphingomonas sp. BT553]MBJ6123429.1 TonB-dependent receptor [Sphingomonas sp. BT553]